jgi:hypothetical protein
LAKQQQTAGTQLTSQPERLPLAGTLMYRSSARDKDQRFINCFQESIKNEVTDSKKVFLVKRPGLTRSTQILVGGGTARGLIYWDSAYYAVIGNKLYENGTEKQTLTTSTGEVGFCLFDNAGVEYLFLCDGTDGYVINAAGTVTQVNQTYSAWAAATAKSVGDRVIPTVVNGYYYEVTATSGVAPYTTAPVTQPTWPITIGTTVVDNELTWTCMGEYGGFPTPHIPRPEFIDGYMLLAAANSMDIYNSDVDNIYGWGGGNFVSAEMWPDNIVALARQNNQLVAFGSISTEFFYDAASASGSPFARNEGTVLQIGNVAPYAIYENERFLIFIGQSESGGRAAWMIEGFSPKKVSTEAIERILDAAGSAISTAKGFGIRTKGHLFYVINLASCTLVYDVEEKVWHEWSTNVATAHTTFTYNYHTDIGSGKAALLHNTDGYIYTVEPLIYEDNATAILADAYTMKYDGGTMNRKFMHNLNVVSDQNSTYTIRWSDDDYTTWNSFLTLNATRPFITRLGSFRRRAFNVRHTANEDFRIEAIEFEVDVGTH